MEYYSPIKQTMILFSLHQKIQLIDWMSEKDVWQSFQGVGYLNIYILPYVQLLICSTLEYIYMNLYQLWYWYLEALETFSLRRVGIQRVAWGIDLFTMDCTRCTTNPNLDARIRLRNVIRRCFIIKKFKYFRDLYNKLLQIILELIIDYFLVHSDSSTRLCTKTIVCKASSVSTLFCPTRSCANCTSRAISSPSNPLSCPCSAHPCPGCLSSRAATCCIRSTWSGRRWGATLLKVVSV